MPTNVDHTHLRCLQAIALGFTINAWGCAPRGPTSAYPHLDARSPATVSVSAGALADMTLGESRFRLATGDTEGEVILLRREATALYGASVAVHEGDRRVEYLTMLDDGSIALTAVVDRDERALTLFTPPLLIAPPVLEPGQPFVSSASMRVVASDNPARQREQGRAKRRMTAIADVSIERDGRMVSAVQIEIEFHADLRFADARERTVMLVSPTDGVLAIDSEEIVTILGAFPRTSRRSLHRE